jgi:hypothetical protein
MPTADPVIPPEALEPRRGELLRRIAELDQDFIVDANADDPAARALALSLLFEHWPELAGEDLDAGRRFYNRYYWLVRFLALRQLTHGPDGGLEQQAFKLIEDAANHDLDVDWDLVKQIDTRARNVPGSSG